MRARKVDGNQVDIVAAFRELGCKVLHLHTVGKGCPDLAVALRGITALVEIKDGQGKLNDDQLDFYNEWPGLMFIVRTTEDVRRAVHVLQSEYDLRLIGVNKRCNQE